MEFHLSRNGEVFGTFTLEQIRHGLNDGTIMNSDFAWSDGMDEWKVLSLVIPPPPPPSRAATSHPPTSPAWRFEPATERQIAYLTDFGADIPQGLTKGAASEMLNQLTNDEQAIARLHDNKKRKAEEERKQRAQHPSYSMRCDIKEAKRGLEEADSEERASWREELKNHQSLRIDFWRATFNGNWHLSDEACELIDFAGVIEALYENFGRYFKVPPRKRVQDILDALDSASADWDLHEPHAFFATLHASFPDSMRKR